MTVGKARRARARMLVVPVVVSCLIWIVVGELLLGRYGPAVLLVAVPVLAAAASTRMGQKWLARVFLGARGPKLHQRHTLAPVAEILLRQGVQPERLVLLVGPGREVDVSAIGRQTVVVSQGLVERIWSGHLPPHTAASVIAHEVGVMRAGLTRRDPGMMVLLATWKVWLTFILILWGIAAAFLPHRLMVASLVINAGVGIWLGATEHAFMYVTTPVMGVVLWTWWASRSWSHARAQIGDSYLTQTGLGGVYADFLTANFTDDHARDRAVRLWRPELQNDQPVSPGRQPESAVAVSTTGR